VLRDGRRLANVNRQKKMTFGPINIALNASSGWGALSYYYTKRSSNSTSAVYKLVDSSGAEVGSNRDIECTDDGDNTGVTINVNPSSTGGGIPQYLQNVSPYASSLSYGSGDIVILYNSDPVESARFAMPNFFGSSGGSGGGSGGGTIIPQDTGSSSTQKKVFCNFW